MSQTPPRFRCTFEGCGISYTRPDNLAAHRKTHEPGHHRERFPCETCGKNFGRDIDMRRHCDTVHLQGIAYKCDNCDQGFQRKDARDR